METKFKNLAQLKRYLKDNEGKVYYKFIRSDGYGSVRRCLKVMTDSLVSLNEENRQIFYEWGNAGNYEFTSTGFTYKDEFSRINFDMTVTDKEITDFEKAVQSAKEREVTEKKIQEMQKNEAQKIELQKLETCFALNEPVKSDDFLKLCDFYHLKIPARIKWFISENVETVWIKENGAPSYSHRKKGIRSESIWKVIVDLRDKIKQKNK